MTTTYKRFVPALLTLLLLAATHGVRAEYQKLEAIVAVVDDDVVLASELVARLETVKRSIQEENIQPPPADVLVSQLMERLIIENIQL
ncbi:MAG TPA: molecular chaperone SurA, partial [Gammaproteobacteria bacterium]|nr:molecular chaperone SurA [Gammaproteobacteria bacterium]